MRDDLRLYLIQTAEKGMAWLNLIADGRAGHGSLRQRRQRSHRAQLRPSPGSAAYEWPRKITDAQRAFLEAVAEAFDIDLDPDQVEETLGRLGSIARMVGATMSNTANPTMLTAGYKHNVIPGRAHGRYRRPVRARRRGRVLRHHHRSARRPRFATRSSITSPRSRPSSPAPWSRRCRPAWLPRTRRRRRCRT